MRRRDYCLLGFAALVVLQLAVPGSRLAMREWTLRTGTRFRFKTAPVDPYDAFRGRYVAVSVPSGAVPLEGPMPAADARVYASVETGEDGFARLVAASATRPGGSDYLAARMRGTLSTNEVELALPFDRFYMNEKLAPEAERAYQRRDDQSEAWLAVRVRKGMAVIEELYIGEQPIAEFLKANK